ncbi:hypothetical protein [Phenylobacterium sp.]|uniref:hypothetical protein n=1 Tax=Phenylobacterium sp. TaxID=1871053 RepID=UPI00272F4025|nr:hypothetical protein [Phenylobacterium sp.]MDP2214984.1 hypothetical protein [Phenylobacterium sp.]
MTIATAHTALLAAEDASGLAARMRNAAEGKARRSRSKAALAAFVQAEDALDAAIAAVEDARADLDRALDAQAIMATRAAEDAAPRQLQLL